MKRFYGIVIFLLLSAVLLSGCRPANMEGTGDSSTPPVTTTRHIQPTQPTTEPIRELTWQEDMIAIHLLDGNKEYTERISFREYATFGDMHVTFMDCPCHMYMDVIEQESLGECLFVYPSSQRLLVYREGDTEFLQLKDAYQAGWFTDDELASLHEKYMSRDYTEE